MNGESLFRCPVCARPLIRTDRTYKCGKNHIFDISAQGYVNLLGAGDKHSRFPGDDKEMARARRDFLSGGHYGPLAAELSRLALCFAPGDAAVVDAGCGEGYYTAAVFDALTKDGRTVRAAGLDISKFILKYAAKRAPGIEFAVASSYKMPLADGCADVLINCFSPLALSEFGRVLKPGGIFIYVVPGRRHLYELKEILYDEPYENEEKLTPYEGFSYKTVAPVRTSFTLTSDAEIENLFKMTPYYWKTPRAGRERLRAMERLDITAEFNIHVFGKDV